MIVQTTPKALKYNKNAKKISEFPNYNWRLEKGLQNLKFKMAFSKRWFCLYLVPLIHKPTVKSAFLKSSQYPK